MSHCSWPATERYELDPAPGSLALVQDFLNTAAIGTQRTDLLAEPSTAQTWAEEVADRWSSESGQPKQPLTLGRTACAHLQEYRQSLRTALADAPSPADTANRTPVISAEISLGMNTDGLVVATPQGGGAQTITSMLLIAMWQAQGNDTWRRLKTCRNPLCHLSFYDRSRNNSGTWHNVKTCGNAANLRAYRARRRSANQDTGPDGEAGS
ncbi:CGNR zinc finger domain-containing protein [Streptomyces sp. NPDC001002]